jgi:hypothetical protein
MKTIIKNFQVILAISFLFLLSGPAYSQDEIADSEPMSVMPAQLTFISPLGTNGMQSGRTINIVSVNMLAGISGGVRGVELGGLANVSKGNVTGLQAAGLVNSSLGYANGLQLAGLVNFNKGFVNGAQLAGLVNLTTAEFEGAQMAGLINVNTKDLKGFQAAGLINTTTGIADGLQLAGVTNVATTELRGAQIGLINYTNTLNGFQLGLINVADSVGKGAGLGLFTFYRNGYHAFELEYNETFRANATFKSGVDKLYMIYTLGFKTDNNKTYWSPGIGLGSNFHLSERTSLNVDLISRQVNEDEWWTNELNLLNTLRLDVAWNISDRVAFYGGPTYNVVVSGIQDNEGNVVGDSFSPWSFYDKTYNNNRVKMYFGFNAGFRF